MVFSSLLFLFFFLPITLMIYFVSPKKIKNTILLIVSLIFYAWGEPIYIGLLIFSACIDYFHGLLIYKYRSTKGLGKAFLFSSLLVNIALLSFFKYADFLIINMNHLIGTDLPLVDLPLPIGISFYTFQTMSYCIDVYRGQIKPQKNFIAFAMYVSLFPQLIAGPIVRYKEIEQQIIRRAVHFKEITEGVKLFIIGLGKKVLLANNIGMLWMNVQDLGSGELTVFTAWLGIIAFSFQIYFDFSGYSDMAIGLGKMFGFNFPRNFHYPYISRSVTEFWRRWHITLGIWFRDYLYFPLGGSKRGKIITIRNLLIVWGVTGLWHGASWNFVLWGLYFAIIIIIEKTVLLKLLSKWNRFFQHLYLIMIIIFGWVLFAFDDLPLGLNYLKIMLGLSPHELFDQKFLYYLYTNFILLLIVVIGSTPFIPYLRDTIIAKLTNRKKQFVENFVVPTLYIMILFLSTAYLVDASFNPFLYFRF